MPPWSLGSAHVSGSVSTAPPLPPRTGTPAGAFRVVHHRFDDSIFIDGGYVIRGVAGRLLV